MQKGEMERRKPKWGEKGQNGDKKVIFPDRESNPGRGGESAES